MKRFFGANFCILIILATLSGCSVVEPLIFSDPKIAMVWPAPPNVPRIQYLRNIAGAEDILVEKGRLSKVFDMLTGEPGENIEFETPAGIATDNASIIYVADTTAQIVHRYDTVKREVLFIDRAGDQILSSPVGVAVDSTGNLYLTDSLLAKVFIYNKNGVFQGELGAETRFLRPAGIAINTADEKYVVDVLAHKLKVFDKNNKFIGNFPKIESQEKFNRPTNVAIDRYGGVYVTDAMNFTVRKFDRDGNLLATIGQIGDAPGSFARPRGVAIDSDLNIYVLDAAFDNMQIFNQDGRLLLFVGKSGVGPGDFYIPSGLFIDKTDRIFVTDTYNRRIQIFQYLKEGFRQ